MFKVWWEMLYDQVWPNKPLMKKPIRI